MGRLDYFDPSDLMGDSNSIQPYENYSMAVDLIVEIPDRYSCGLGKENGLGEKFEYSTSNGTLSILGGTKINDEDSKGYLTTNFTDVSMTNPGSNTSECFGIESISISFEKKLFPIVNIKFIDVRGATLMSPAEAGYYNKSDLGNSAGLYRAFFMMPYPTFILKIKGYYGNGSTYRLTLQKADIEFNCQTGNFNISAAFVGDRYGIYSDLPIQLLSVAPYTVEGSQYWDEQVANGTFAFFNGNGVKTVEMFKLPEIKKRIDKAIENQDVTSISYEGEVLALTFDEEEKMLYNLRKNYPFTVKNEWHSDSGSVYYYKTITTPEGVYDELKKIYNYYLELKAYDEISTAQEKGQYKYSSQLEYISFVKDFANTSIKDYHLELEEERKEELGFDTRTESTKLTNPPLPKPEQIANSPVIDDVLDKLMNATHIDKSVYDSIAETYEINRISDINNPFPPRLVVLPNTVDLFKYIERDVAIIRRNKNELINAYKAKKQSLQEKILGFKPTVRNMYNLMFAHMETFMHVFYTYNKAIYEDIYLHSNARKKTYQGIANNMTDTPNAVSETSIYNFLPPYTSYYQKEHTGKNIEVWVDYGTIHPNEIVETSLVNDLLNAGGSLKTEVEKLDAAPTLITNLLDELEIGVYDFIPVTPYDFVFKDKMENPYKWIADAAKKEKYSEGIISQLICMTFALRVYAAAGSNLIGVNYKVGGVLSEDHIKIYRNIGEIEFINFAKAFSDATDTKGFLYFIRVFFNDENFDNYKHTALSTYLTEKKYHKDKLPLFTFKESAVTRGPYIDLSSNYSSGLWYESLNTLNLEALPIGEFNIFEIIKDIDTGGYKNNEKYLKIHNITETAVEINDKLDDAEDATHRYYIGDLTAGSTNDPETFYIINSGDYISSIVGNFNKELNSGKIKYATKQGFGDIINLYQRLFKLAIDTGYGEETIVNKGTDNYIKPENTKTIFSQSMDTKMKNYFIKKPFKFDEKMEEGILNSKLITDNIDYPEFQAYILLNAMPIDGVGEFGNILRQNENGIASKALLLREGAYYWYEEDGSKIEGLKWENYVPVQAREMPLYDNEMSSYETLLLEKSTELNEWSYNKWMEPHLTTGSRKRVLKEYFVNWVNDTGDLGFKGNIERLMNLNLQQQDTFWVVGEMMEKSEFRGTLREVSTTEGTSLVNEYLKLQKFLMDLFFGVETIFDMYNHRVFYNPNLPNKKSNEDISTRSDAEVAFISNDLTSAWKGFTEAFAVTYKSIIDNFNNAKQNDTTNTLPNKLIKEHKNDAYSNDMRLSLYNTLKSLYEKWLCLPQDSDYRDRWTLGNKYSNTSDFEQFVYADTYYFNIGDKFTVDLNKISEMLSSCVPSLNNNNSSSMAGSNFSVFAYLDRIAQDNGAMLFAAPNGAFSNTNVEDRFKAKSINERWDDINRSFVFMYSYKPSEHLGSTDTATLDINGWPGNGDGLDLDDTKTTDELFGNQHEDSYKIPAFCVTYAKQNQSMFKNIRLNSTSAGVTDTSIAQTLNIASKESDGPRETLFFGQDIYKVMTNKVYNCSVESMGNTQILPMMYFQLNNIPFWKGAYLISKVTHEIQPGNFTTRFEGYRINKNALPLANNDIIIIANMVDDEGGYNGNVLTSSYINSIIGNIKNWSADTSVELIGGLDVENPANITKTNPLICVTPAHGPKTDKKDEWQWSVKVVDKLTEALSGAGYNVHYCNKKGDNTTKGGYNTTEIYRLIRRFGSDKVISVVPHWNAGGGNKYEILLHWKGCERPDSVKFAECMKSAVEDTIKDKEKFGDYKKAIGNIVEINPLDKYQRRDNRQDGGPRLDCACMITENWFTDFNYVTGKSGAVEYDLFHRGKIEKCPDNLFYYGLHDEKIIDIIVDMHVEGIRRYIETLKE